MSQAPDRDEDRRVIITILDKLSGDFEVLLADLRSLRARLSGARGGVTASQPVPIAEGAPPGQAAPTQTGPRVIMPSRIFAPLESATSKGEVSRPAAELAEATRRFMEMPYTGHMFTIAPNPITPTGNSFDLGRIVDYIMVMPTVDAYIDFDVGVSPETTPPVFAGVLFAWNMRAQKIYYQGVNQSTTGKLYVWAAWW
jgi:hypothetical protein